MKGFNLYYYVFLNRKLTGFLKNKILTAILNELPSDTLVSWKKVELLPGKNMDIFDGNTSNYY